MSFRCGITAPQVARIEDRRDGDSRDEAWKRPYGGACEYTKYW